MEEAFLSWFVTADETWVHHFDPETKRSRTRNGTGRAYTHLFVIGARIYKWTETLWKNRIWRQTFSLECAIFMISDKNFHCGKNGSLLSGQLSCYYYIDFI
jgi:hypothetical protein